MQLDFHYDVTYIAARIAGFDAMEAEAIAWAAQYVDDAVAVDTKKINLPSQKTHDFTNILTASNMGIGQTLYKKEHVAKTLYADKHRQIWAIFHFPPGNYLAYRKGGGAPLPGHLLRSFRGKSEAQVLGKNIFQPRPQDVVLRPGSGRGGDDLTALQEDQLTKEHFPLITRPNSDLVRAMIADTIKRYKDLAAEGDVGKRIALTLLGIRMHVFADTWAHQDHVGAPDRRFNRVESFGWYKLAGRWDQNFNYEPGLGFTNDSPGGTQPVAGYHRDQFMWLGHGPMGNWPDLPWAVYRWKPRWSENEILRNNPQEFLQAFVNLTFVMKVIKNDMGVFSPQLSPGAYRNVVGADNIDRFKQAIAAMYNLRNLGKMRSPEERQTIWGNCFSQFAPPKYNPERAENDVANIRKGVRGFRSYDLKEFLSTRYFQFHYAAKVHYQFMRNELRSQGFRVIFDDHARQEAMINDYVVFKREMALVAGTGDAKLLRVRDMVAKAITDLYTKTSKEEVQLGIQLLASDLETETTPEAILTKLINIMNLELAGESAYRLFSESGIKKRLEALREELEKFIRWVPDSAVTACAKCGKAFGFTTRRHHCRQCARIFCDACSKKSILLPHRGYHKPVRVCDDCYARFR